MQGYTTSELKSAFCRAKNFTATPEKTENQFVVEQMSELTAQRTSSVAYDVKRYMRQIALNKLDEEQNLNAGEI
jgi:hypothetical protein